MCIHRLQHALLLCATLATATLAQNNPVYVDESPTAAERIKQIDLMAGPNPQEAAALLQSLLEDAGGQILPLPDAPTRFSGIRTLLLQRLPPRRAVRPLAPPNAVPFQDLPVTN